jgi:hypothetical protein
LTGFREEGVSMARIPAAEIERLKREVSLECLAEARGIGLARHGADLLGLCPFHDDHEPSLVITPSRIVRSSRSVRFSRRRRPSSSFSALVGPSDRLPSSRSACRTQFRIAWDDGSNSRARSSGFFPERTSSTIRRRDSGGYGA